MLHCMYIAISLTAITRIDCVSMVTIDMHCSSLTTTIIRYWSIRPWNEDSITRDESCNVLGHVLR